MVLPYIKMNLPQVYMCSPCFLISLESALDCKGIKPVHPKGNQPWIFIGRTDDESEALILWPPDVNNWLTGKDPDAGKDWRQEEKGMTEDEMVGWHYRLNGHEFEQAVGVDAGQGKPGVLQSMGSQRVRHDWGTELADWPCHDEHWYYLLIGKLLSLVGEFCWISPLMVFCPLLSIFSQAGWYYFWTLDLMGQSYKFLVFFFFLYYFVFFLFTSHSEKFP